MNWKLSLVNRRAFVNALGAILGISLLLLFGFALSGWFRTVKTVKEGIPAASQSQPVSAPKESDKQPPSTPQSQEQSDPTAGWKEITDERLELSFKVPPEWNDFGIFESDFATTRKVGNISVPSLFGPPAAPSGMIVDAGILRKILFTEFRDRTPQDYFTHLTKQPKGVLRQDEDFNQQMRREEDLSVAGYPAVAQVVMPREEAQTESFYIYEVYFVVDSTVYKVQAMTPSEKVWQQHKPVFNQILQSISFLSARPQ
jgi:hypothetical protein